MIGTLEHILILQKKRRGRHSYQPPRGDQPQNSVSRTQLGAKSGDHHRGVRNDPSHVTSHRMSHRMGYFNFKWQVYSASATRRTYDRNTDKGEVGGSSPPRPTIQIKVRPGDMGYTTYLRHR